MPDKSLLFLLLLCALFPSSGKAQKKFKTHTYTYQEVNGRPQFADGYLLHTNQKRLHVTSFLGAKADTFSFDIKAEKLLGTSFQSVRRGDTLVLSGYYATSVGTAAGWRYNFDILKIYDKKIHKVASVSMPYAFASERHYLFADDKIVLYFASGNNPYFGHFSVPRGREIYHTPSLPYVKNPGAGFFSYDSDWSLHGDLAVFMMRESGGTKAHFCLHDINKNAPLTFIENIDFPPGWSTRHVLYTRGKIYLHGTGYESREDYAASNRAKQFERIYELNVRTRQVKMKELRPYFADAAPSQSWAMRPVFTQIDDAIYLTYNYTLAGDDPKIRKYRSLVLQLQLDDFTLKTIEDEVSDTAKTVYLFGEKKLEIVQDRSDFPNGMKYICTVKNLKNEK